MNIWILTIGSSDVQLKPQNNWTILFRTGRSKLKPDRGFSPSKSSDSDCLRVPARVMGVIYSQIQATLDDLIFPLIDNFINKLKSQKITIDKVILVLSNQSIFSEKNPGQKHPYWQDTYTLQPILENYLTAQWKDVSPDLEIKPLILEATSEEAGLDNWNAVLTLVQQKFSLSDLIFPADATIYVSHQAGTPAISSAVQFCSLARFGDRVKFVVSNEYNPTLPEEPLEGSSYLRGIRIQEAKALLGAGSYNYAGVEALIGKYIKENEEIKTLLKAAKNWNFAKFNDFLKCLRQHPKFASEVAERARDGNWWWIAYEEAYLAAIRERQDNIVEAFFHSFRAFEYLFAAWGFQKLTDHVEKVDSDSVSFLKETILDDSRFRELTGDRKKAVSGIQAKFKAIAEKIEHGERIRSEDKVEFGFFNLCNLFKAFNYADYKGSCSCLNVFFGKDNVRDRRNAIVHQVKGLSITDLCTYWGVHCSEDLEDIAERNQNVRDWKNKLVNLLNCIVKEDFPEGFATLEEASLMVQVHQELERAIADL